MQRLFMQATFGPWPHYICWPHYMLAPLPPTTIHPLAPLYAGSTTAHYHNCMLAPLYSGPTTCWLHYRPLPYIPLKCPSPLPLLEKCRYLSRSVASTTTTTTAITTTITTADGTTSTTAGGCELGRDGDMGRARDFPLAQGPGG